MTTTQVPSAGTRPQNANAVLADLDAACIDSGYLEPLGSRHWAYFADEGPVLLVAFERLGTISAAKAEGRNHSSYAVAAKHGWSYLCLIADGDTWYRDGRVWSYFDRLIDDGFFEDFDRVVFYGAGMGGYAACAYSVAAPGASVLAVRPVATLSPDRAGWDRRFLRARGLDFRSRFGYAPHMLEGAAEAYLLFDPDETEDAMHAALFDRPWVRTLLARHHGPEAEADLARMGLLAPLIEAAGQGRLSAALWQRMWRARRDDTGWLRRFHQAVHDSGNTRREARLLRAAIPRGATRWMRKRLLALEQDPLSRTAAHEPSE